MGVYNLGGEDAGLFERSVSLFSRFTLLAFLCWCFGIFAVLIMVEYEFIDDLDYLFLDYVVIICTESLFMIDSFLLASPNRNEARRLASFRHYDFVCLR